MKNNIEHRIELLELQALSDQSCAEEPPGPLCLYLYWFDAGEESLSAEQRESNRRCREWTAKHPGAFSNARLEWW